MTQLKRVTAVLVAVVLALVSLAAPARAATVEAVKAADYIVANGQTPPSVGAVADEVLALASTNEAKYNSVIAARLAYLKLNAAAYVTDTGPAGAAKLAIVAGALGQSATNFGGTNLVAAIKAGIKPDGEFGSWPGPFASGLGMVALARAGEPIPAAMVTYLLTYKSTDNGFGYSPGQATGDIDNTVMAVLGLQAAQSTDPALAAAIAWLAGKQLADGSWANYSPVNSAGMAGPLMDAPAAARAAAYVKTQQLPSGGLKTGAAGAPDANLMATTQGIFALTGKTYATISYALTTVPVTVTAASAGTRPVGVATNTWGKVTGLAHADVWTEVQINGRWSKSQVGTTDALGNYVLPLTYGINTVGVLTYRVGVKAGTGSAYSAPFTLTRTAAVTAMSAGSKPVGQGTNVWGNAGAPNVRVWTEVLINGRWSTSQVGRSTASGSYVLALTYGTHAPGVYTYRVGATTTAGTGYSKTFTITRTAAVTAMSAGSKPVGQGTNVWGNAGAPNVRVWTEVLLNGRWSTSQVGTSTAGGSYVLALTYGVNTRGTYTYRVGALVGGSTVHSAQFTLQRV